MSPNWDLGIVNEPRERPRVSYEEGREGKHTDGTELLLVQMKVNVKHSSREPNRGRDAPLVRPRSRGRERKRRF